MTSGPDGVAGGGLLIGFYVMCAALVAGLIAVTAFAVVRWGANRGTFALVAVRPDAAPLRALVLGAVPA